MPCAGYTSCCFAPPASRSSRRRQLAHLRGGDHDDLAQQAADDALMAILAKLDSFRGASRFTTWAYKFALLEAGVKARRRGWQGREIPIDEQMWPTIAEPRPLCARPLEATDLLEAVAGRRPLLADAPSADRLHRARAQRRSDRRAGGAPALDARRVVQDAARRSAQAARRAGRRGLPARRRTRRRRWTRTLRITVVSCSRDCSDQRSPRSRARSASSCSTSTSTSSSRGRTPIGACPGCARICKVARRVVRITRACATSCSSKS